MQKRLLACVSTALACACSAASDGPSANVKTYTGTFSTSVVESTVSTSLTGGGTFPCTNTYTMSGTVSMTLDAATGAPIGSATVAGQQTETAFSGGTGCLSKGGLPIAWAPQVTGAASALQFSAQNVATNGGYIVTSRTTFTGGLANGAVTGTLGFSVSGGGTIGTTSIAQSYNTTIPVTLR